MPSEAFEETREFYAMIGLQEVMNHGWVMTLASPDNPTAQITFASHDATSAVRADVSIEVDDVHAAMVAAGTRIVHPLQDEEWGVRRFFAVDPNGRVINVVTHARG